MTEISAGVNKTEMQSARASARGRPRNTEVDAAVLRAGWAVLGRAGYSGLTFEAVAEQAGCSRPALYRRFANKRDLVLELIRTRTRELEPEVDEEVDPRHALTEHLKGMVRYLQGDAGPSVLALSQARRADPQLSEALEELFVGERERYVRALNARGQIPAQACHVIIDAMLGAVMFRVALRNADMNEDEIDEIVELALQRSRALAIEAKA